MTMQHKPADNDIEKATEWLKSLTDKELDWVLQYLRVRKTEKERRRA